MMANYHKGHKLSILSLSIQIVTLTMITCFSIKDNQRSLVRSVYPRFGDQNNETSTMGSNENDTHSEDFKVIKEVTVEEILDLDPEPKAQTLARLAPTKPEEGTMDLIATESLNNAKRPHDIHGVTDRDHEIVKRVAIPRRQVELVEQSATANPNRLVSGGQQELRSNDKLLQINERKSDNEYERNQQVSDLSFSDIAQPAKTNVTVSAARTVAEATKRTAGDPVLSDSRESKQLADNDENDSAHTSGTSFAADYHDGLDGRTRITLNAAAATATGYVQANNQQLGLPTTPHLHQRDKIGLGVGDDRLERFHNLPSAQVGGSKVIFVPDRIIVADDILQPSSSNNKQLQMVVANVANKLVVKKNRTSTSITATTTPIGKLDSRCPKQGIVTLEHPSACDKYFYCEDGLISEQTCPNGLLYGTRDVVKDYCVYRWTTTCNDRTIPNPISSPGCRWQYGIFTVQGSPKCSSSYYECSDGKYKIKKCSLDGQVYDDRSKSCKPSSMIGCGEQAVSDFHCPPDDQANTYWPFPRYYLNEFSLIHCVNEEPELVKCNKDERVDPVHLHCVPISKRIIINKQESSPN